MRTALRAGGMVLVILIPAMAVCSSGLEPAAVQTPQQAAAAGAVLRPDEGEILRLRRPGDGQVTIKVDPLNTGSRRVAMGTQQMGVGYRIPIHRHETQDEILFVHRGSGTAILGEERVPVETGTTIYVPEGVWHGVENTSQESAEIIWVVAPPGLESFFRDMGAPPGTEAPLLSAEEAAEISRRHGVTVRTQ